MKYKKIILSLIAPLFVGKLCAMQLGSESISNCDDSYNISHNNSSTNDGKYDPEVVKDKLNSLMIKVKVNEVGTIDDDFKDFSPNFRDLVKDIDELKKKKFKGEAVMEFGKKWGINGLDIYDY